MSNNAHDLSNRLLNALDNNYNVVDMHTVNEIISVLEKFNITKELLETTRLGKHVNELRRKTTDPTLARRAKVLVKRWRDLVIPNVASPAHTGSNRSSSERSVRRLGGTPLTSPALTRQVVSPAVPSPRPSRPAWGGYESDSQDVILVDDDPPPAPASASAPASAASSLAARLPAHKPLTPPVKRPPSPEPPQDDKKAKRDKKPKKRRGHSRAGAGAEMSEGAGGGAGGGGSWSARNGTHPERRRNGCRRDAPDTYAALVSRMPRAGDKKVKTTKELLEQIQSRGSKPPKSPAPASPSSPDVMLIEPELCPIKVDSPLRNGGSEPSRVSTPPRSPTPLPPLEDEREYAECTCGEIAEESCPAARRLDVHPLHVRALHCVYLPGVNGTRAPLHPHQFAVRKPFDPEQPGLFTSVVPLYKYSDYADDYCVKNMSKVPLCTHLPWTEFAPPPPDLPPPKSPPPLRPYPLEIEIKHESNEIEDSEALSEYQSPKEEKVDTDCPKIELEMIGVPKLEPSERLKAPLLSTEEETQFKNESKSKLTPEVEKEFESETPEHRTVERTKGELDGNSLYELCEKTIEAVPYDYSQVATAPIITLPDDGKEAAEVLETALTTAQDCERDELGRPLRATNFAEWHECAQLGRLIALPYVVID